MFASGDERRRVRSRLLSGAPRPLYVPSTPLRRLPSHLHEAIGGFVPCDDMLSLAATSSWALALRPICLRRLALKPQPVDRLSLELRRAASTDERRGAVVRRLLARLGPALTEIALR
jgi:hypothetical protein